MQQSIKIQFNYYCIELKNGVFPMRPITQEKLDELTKFMDESAIDAIVISDWEDARDVNMRFLTGHPMDGTLVVLSSGEICLVPWDLQLAEDHAQADTILDFKEFPNRRTGGILHFIKENVKNPKPVIGVNQGIIYSVVLDLKKNIPGVKIFDEPSKITAKFTKLRSTKSPQEMDKLFAAGKIGNKTIKDIKKFAEEKEGTENDLSFLVMKKMKEYGAEDNSFPSLVANTSRSHMIHCHPSAANNHFAATGLSLIDFGALLDGYCCDITIPFTFGKLTAEQEKIRDTTVKAYYAAIEVIDLGVPLWKISKAATDIMDKAGYKMPHSLGHGLGLAVHDSPSVRPKPTDADELKGWTEYVVEEGMIFTIEPGVYVKGLGGQRLENDVMIRNGKVEVYTKSELVEIE